MPAPFRFEIRVKPGSSGTSVGGTWGDDGPLNVAVTEQAIDGKANAAALELLATMLKVRKRQLSIISGHRHRTKLIELQDPAPSTLDLLDRLRFNQ